MTNYLLAGGGTGGHVNPMLALADEIKLENSASSVYCLGTREGLEARLVPERGYELLTIARLPFPRKLGSYALTFLPKFLAAVKQVRSIIQERQIDVVVGFGGYASAPAYLAARLEKVSVVVHEANALAGIANRMGARFAAAVGVAFKNSNLKNSIFVGMPLRREFENLLESTDKSAARKYFKLDANTVTVLVTGGSLGAKRINQTIEETRNLFSAAGIQVLHIVGERSEYMPETNKDFVRLSYCDRMDLAVAAADFAISRAGASTVSEFSALGLPAMYVPYPVGNGEQKYNVVSAVAAGGAMVVADADFSAEFVARSIIPLVSDSRRLKKMAAAAKAGGVSDGAKRLLTLVQGVLPPK